MLTFNPNIIPKTKGAYIVGGSIRDILTQAVPNDYDFAVSGSPKEFARHIAKNTNGHIVSLGKPGLVLYRVSSEMGIFDISPLIGNSISEDLEKRDFTINAIAVDLSNGKIIDPLNGIKDLKSGKIRMISERAFTDDPIRLLRAYRLGSQFNFNITRLTSNAIKKNSSLIKNSAGERIHAELIKIFKATNSFKYLEFMTDSRLIFEIFPELKSLSGCQQNHHHDFDVFDHTRYAYKELEDILNNPGLYIPGQKNSYHKLKKNAGILKCAMLLHDIGKPNTKSISNNNIHFYGHEKEGAKMAAVICDRLKFSTSQKNYICHIIKNHLRPLFLHSSFANKQLSGKAKTKFFLKASDACPDLILHALADSRGKKKNIINKCKPDFTDFSKTLISDYFNCFIPIQEQKALLTGQDLINDFFLSPSPKFKIILNQIEEARLEGKISTKQDAYKMVRRLI